MKLHSVEVGDEILVNGFRFILIELKFERDQPATVTFKQPSELGEMRSRGPDLVPLPEDVRGHALGYIVLDHEDGRQCGFHHRLQMYTPDGVNQCLREHHLKYPKEI